MYLGPSSLHKRFKCLAKSGKIFISHHVTFNDFEFPFAMLFFFGPNREPTHFPISLSNIQPTIPIPIFPPSLTPSTQFITHSPIVVACPNSSIQAQVNLNSTPTEFHSNFNPSPTIFHLLANQPNQSISIPTPLHSNF